MDGVNCQVKYSKEDGSFSDMHDLLAKLFPKQCQFFLFKYTGAANFRVFLLDGDYVLQGIPGLIFLDVHFLAMVYIVHYLLDSAEKMLAFDGLRGDLSLFFQDVFPITS
ncbi:hypothetical protein ACET3Z_026711 [Daucus carota]